MNKSDIQLILNQLKIDPKKYLGQNFLYDHNTIDKIIREAEISENDVILEIGPGLGALTEKLLAQAKKVYAIEIQKEFCSFLTEKFANIPNLEIIHGDILKINLPCHNKVVSNIPYSITGPILEKIFFKEEPSKGILTVETKIAERIFSTRGYNNLSRVTISVNSFMDPIRKMKISPKGFFPEPKIKLSLIKLHPKKHLDSFLKDGITRRFYLNLIRGIMPYKNKDIINALELYIKNTEALNLNKEELSEILFQENYANNKLFQFKTKDFINIAKKIYNRNKR